MSARTRQRKIARLELTVLPPLHDAPPGRLQILARLDGAQVVGELPTSGGAAGETWRGIIAAHEALRVQLGNEDKPRPPPHEMELLGDKLFSLLFPPPIRALYEKARQALHMELVFTSLVPWIADKPWELLHDPRGSFLARGKVRFSRSVPGDVPGRSPSPRRGAMHVLIAVAEPRGEARVSWEEESKAIAAGFAPLEERDLLRATVVQAATPGALQRALLGQRYDVLHFIGHGGWDAERDQGYLLFEDHLGKADRVSPAELVELLRDRGLRLLVLNACETGRGSRKGTGVEFNRGVAPALLAAGLPAVLANQYPVFDRPAAAFIERFYVGLGLGEPVSEAVRAARISISNAGERGAIDWAIPVLYARDPGQRLCAGTRRLRKARVR